MIRDLARRVMLMAERVKHGLADIHILFLHQTNKYHSGARKMRLSLITITLLSSFSMQAFAQKKITEPDLYNVVFFSNPASNNLEPLEKVQAVIQSKAKAFGIGGVATFIEVPGKTSPVALISNSNLTFVVKLMDINDSKTFELYNFDVSSKTNTRTRIKSKLSAFSQSSPEASIAFDVGNYGASSAQFIVDSNLPAGQYCFISSSPTPSRDLTSIMQSSSAKAFCFELI